jgi:hypothetical protein
MSLDATQRQQLEKRRLAPLATLGAAELSPGAATLAAINATLR